MTVTAKSLGIGTGATLLLKEFGADLVSGTEAARIAMPLQYAGDPTNNVVPDFKGQICTDTSSGESYAATSTAASGWVQITALDGTDVTKIVGITNGTVAASKAAVVDTNKDIGDFRNLDAVNFDAGASGTAGSVDVFPTTDSKGKLIISCDDQDGNTNVTLKPAGMAQASVVSIPDPGAATANVLLTSAANDQSLVNATAVEINMAADISANCEVVTATNVITAAESGKVFFLASTTEFVSTLPAPALGLRYGFIVSAAPSGASYTIVTDSSANVIVGSAVSAEDAAGSVDFEAAGCDTITFVDGKAVRSELLRLIIPTTVPLLVEKVGNLQNTSPEEKSQIVADIVFEIADKLATLETVGINKTDDGVTP